MIYRLLSNEFPSPLQTQKLHIKLKEIFYCFLLPFLLFQTRNSLSQLLLEKETGLNKCVFDYITNIKFMLFNWQ